MTRFPPDDGPLAAALTLALKIILDLGLRPAKLAHAPDTYVVAFGLGPVPDGHGLLETGLAVEREIIAVIDNVYERGQAGEVLRLLLGACSESRSLPLRTRRRLAAEEMDVKVETFLRSYEEDLVADLQAEVFRRHLDALQSYPEDGVQLKIAL